MSVTITAFGEVKRGSPSQMAGVFSIEGRPSQTFDATISPGVKPQPFQSSQATVTFKKSSEIIGQHSYKGTIGIKELKITIANGVVIEGPLVEAIDQAVEIAGVLTWN